MKTASFLFALSILLVTGCNKKDGVPDTPEHTVVFAPSLDIAILPDTVLYDSVVTVQVTTDAQKVRDIHGVFVATTTQIFHLKKDTPITLVGVNYKGKDSAETKKTVTVHVFSENSTKMHQYYDLHCTASKVCVAGTENSPSVVWENAPILDNTYRFFANKTAQVTMGNDSGEPGKKYWSKWAWANQAETEIDFGAGGAPDVWTVILKNDGFDRHRTKNGYYSIETYKKL